VFTIALTLGAAFLLVFGVSVLPALTEYFNGTPTKRVPRIPAARPITPRNSHKHRRTAH
jgi:hypothetical protein